MRLDPILSTNRYKHFVNYYSIGRLDTKILQLKDSILTIKTEYIGKEKTRKLYWLEDKFGKFLKYKYLILENNKIKKVLQNKVS